MEETKAWFEEWFDSKYYHILYQDRDDQEAQNFIDKLSEYLCISQDCKVLDLACGKGRHAIYLNQKGFDVLGLDLSPKSIKAAKAYENDRLHFGVHDMRDSLTSDSFDVILSLFTSFGYFEDREENRAVVRSVYQGLKPGGRYVLDYFNTTKTLKELVLEEEKAVDGIRFNISKKVNDKEFIIKDIRFEDHGRSHHFQEMVKAIPKQRFLNFFEKTGFKIVKIFGDYHLNDFDEATSDRMIFLLEK